MASRYNLTPERKEKLKKEVLEEISKNQRPALKPPKKKITPEAKKMPQPMVFKMSENKPTAKLEIKKSLPVKPDIKTGGVKPRPAKPVFFQEVKETKTKAKKIVKKKPVKQKIQPKEITAVSRPISKKKVQTEEERIKERELFFRPDSALRPSIGTIKLTKPKIKIGHKKMFILGIIICLILAFILALAVDIFGIYKLGWDGPVSQKVINTLPLPAGTVDGRFISLADYRKDLEIVKNVLALTPDIPSADSEKTKEQLFNRLVSINIVENELKKYGKSVTNDLLEEEMKKVISQIGSEEKAASDIKNVYGMDLPTFKNNVLRPILAVDMLNQSITNDENLDINKEARKNADDALRIAQEPGADFKTLVLQYANDQTTLNQSGDMGWFSRGDLPQEIEGALFALKSGEIYNQVVKDDLGYHIYKVESKLADEESGKESIKLNQILITVNTELYIKSLFDKAIIKRFI